MQDIYELGCKTGLLNYIDHETPRVYFVHAHAELEEFEAFCKSFVKERDDEIERLREALQAIYNHQKRMPNIDFTIWEITRAALEEKE